MEMKRKLHILVVEDDEDDLFLLSSLLNDSVFWDFTIDWAPNFQQGKEKMNAFQYDVCFVDHYLGNQTGIEFIQSFNETKMCAPMILLTGIDNIELDSLAIESGAADYIPKSDMEQIILDRSIRHALERHKQLKQVLKEKAKYQRLFEHSLEAIFLADENFNVTQGNSVFWQMLKKESAVDLHLSNLFLDAAIFDRIATELKKEGRRHYFKKLIRDNENNEIVVNLSIWPIFEDGTAGSRTYQGVIHDITELQNAQQRLMETEKFHLTGRMARIIGHEVRNPLTNIVLATEELRATCESPRDDNMDLFTMVSRNVNRINTLIDDLLNSTKMLEINRENVGGNDLVQAALKQCKDRLHLRQIALFESGLEQNTPVHVDIEKFKIVLVNIIINATEALSAVDKPWLKIHFETQNEFHEIQIQDNGCGMSKETIEKIFEPFYTGRRGGLGLGMTNVKNILGQHNAILKVESKEGVGSTFTIKLPI